MAAISAENARAYAQCDTTLNQVMAQLSALSLDCGGGGGGAAPDAHPTAVPELAECAAVRLPSEGGNRAGWIDRLIDDLRGATTIDEARARAARFLDEFDASVSATSRAERDVACHQNGVLKKAFLLLHGMYIGKEAANRELQRQLAECQSRMRSLEMDNYALSMRLRQGQSQGGAMTDRFHPEVF